MTDRGTTAFTAGAVAIGLAGALLLPGAAAAKPGASVADLRGDANRDSVIDPWDEDGWSRERGGIVLPNLDDDARRDGAGLGLGLEAKDLVRDPRRWDGTLTARFTVNDGTRRSTDVLCTLRAAGKGRTRVFSRTGPEVSRKTVAHHLLGGEVHCGTNTLRGMATPWWGSAAG
jgi:hypothetical protein